MNKQKHLIFRVELYICSSSGEDYSPDPYSWNFLGKNLFFMAVEGFVYFILNILFQYRFFLDHWWGNGFRNEVKQICFSLEIFLLRNAFTLGRISDCPKPPVLDEDVDVTEERERIYKSEQTNDILRIRDLSKVRHFDFQM